MFFHTSSGAGRYRLHTLRATDTRPFNFAEFEEQMRPDVLSDAQWNEVRPRLVQRMGSTIGSYVRALAEVATELGDLGIRTFNVNQIFEEMVRQAFDPAPVALTGYVVRDPDCLPVADPKLIAIAADGARTSAFADAEGRYRFYDLDPGLYTIVAQGPGAARAIVPNVVVESHARAMNISLRPEARISGTVSLLAGGPADGILLVSAQLASAPNDPNGRFTFQGNGTSFALGNLVPGTYEVSIRRQGYLPRATTVTLVEGQTLDLGDFALTPAGRISGIVESRVPGLNPNQAVVGVFSGAQQVSQIQVDINGNFDVEDLSAGQYVVRVLELQNAFGTEATIDVVAGQTTGGVQLTILPGGVITGRVTDAVTSAGLANVQVLAYTPDGGITAH